MKTLITFSSTLAVLFLVTALYPINEEEAVQAFKKRMNTAEKLSGTISYTSIEGQNYSGSFKYMAPGCLYIKFSNPQGKLLVSNAKKLWLYDPHTKVCAIQDLDIEGGMSGGITSILEGYTPALLPKEKQGCALKFNNPQQEISDIILYLDDSFFITRGAFLDKEGKGFTFSITNLDHAPDIVKKIFDFDVPPNVQIIKNPLNVK